MRKFPPVREAIESGRLSISAIEILARVLDDDNVEEVRDEAAGMSQEDLRKLAARHRPENPVPDRVDPIVVSADGRIDDSGGRPGRSPGSLARAQLPDP